MRGGDKNTFDCLFLVFKDVIIAGSYAPNICPPNHNQTAPSAMQRSQFWRGFQVANC